MGEWPTLPTIKKNSNSYSLVLASSPVMMMTEHKPHALGITCCDFNSMAQTKTPLTSKLKMMVWLHFFSLRLCY